MPVLPLPVFERDADPTHRDALTPEEEFARLRAPDTVVVRFGSMRMIGEYANPARIRPGCGARLVARTHRGTELSTLLTTTCANSGCSKSVSRQEMLGFIDASGGSDFPFHTEGSILREATAADLSAWSASVAAHKARVDEAEAICTGLSVALHVVEVEPLLGGELVVIHYTAEERVDFREALAPLAGAFGARIEMHQVGARDEARLVADYEKCGQHCCCKNFLKVLQPVSMKSAKTQKATLDPLKISGRCGRLMCCLRYEDQTYEELAKRLPKKKAAVRTPHGDGIVVDTKILVQLVLVRLQDGREIALPVEEIESP